MAKFFHTSLSRDFFGVCAEALLDKYNPSQNPLALTHITVWVPSSRMADSLAESLLEKAGGGVLLPDIRPMGAETDDVLLFDEPEGGKVVSGFERLMFLTEFCMKNMPHAQWSKALNLAKHLDTLWKKMLLSGVEMEALESAIPEEWQTRWEDVTLYLKGLTDVYPRYLQQGHMKDETLYKIDVLKTYTAQYEKNDLANDVWVIGFSDTIDPAQAMLKALSNCDKASFIMPMDKEAFPHVFAEELLQPTHPLYGLQRFMKSWQLSASQLMSLKEDTHTSYVSLFDAVPSLGHDISTFTLCETAHLESEAETVAWAMAEKAMEKEGTCALVTSDLALAFRVQELLTHYGLFVDRTNSSPFVSTPLGTLSLQVLECMMSGYKADMLAGLVLSPVTNRGMKTYAAGTLDASLLRGMIRGTSSLGTWQTKAEITSDLSDEIKQQFMHMLDAFTAFDAQASRSLSEWLKAHLELLLNLADSPYGRSFLMREEEGLKAWQTMIQQTEHMAAQLSFKDYAERFDVLFETVSIPNRTEGAHPRLKILGPLESRLQRYDTVILGGLNEGTTPGRISPDVWLSYEQRRDLGLPPVESSIGLSAHDFLSQLYTAEVILTRRTQSDDGTTLPSRFLMRLKSTMGTKSYEKLIQKGRVIVDAAEGRRLAGESAPLTDYAAIHVSTDASPKAWSPSYVKDMMGCPYKAYMRKGAGVDALEPYNKSPDAALRGTLIHEVLSTFCSEHARLEISHKDIDTQKLIDCARSLLEKELPAAVQAVWMTRFEKLAPDIITFWHERLSSGWHQQALEEKATSTQTPVPLFSVIDRVDGDNAGHLSILDYKTGTLPTKKDVLTGAQPQLILEAMAWLEAHHHSTVKELLYFRLPAGSRDGAKAMYVANNEGQVETLMEQATAGLSTLKALYQGEDKTWPAVAGGVSAVKLEGACEMCDYSGICRVREWVSKEGVIA